MTERDDLDALVTELNAGVPQAPRSTRTSPPTGADDAQTARLRGWLEEVIDRSGSDLLLVAGAAPSVRIDGVVTPFNEAPLGSEEIEDAVVPALPPHARRQYREVGIADGSLRTPDIGRFRINLHHERGRSAAAIRRLPSTVPRFASLNLPPNIEALTRLPHGLVLVGGPTGSGKTTTLAALVNEINHRDARHIVTIEDPIEYEHRIASAWSSRWKSAWTRPTSQPRSGRRSDRRPTSSWSARCAILKRCRLPWPPARPGTWCSRAFTRPTQQPPLAASPTPLRRSVRTPSGKSWRWRLPR